MSHTVSLTKIIYDPSRLKTPNIKDVASSSSKQIEDEKPSPPILMDEYGQTPDHFYLARKPPSYFQVKRKLDLQALHNSEECNDRQCKRKRKLEVTSKPKEKNIIDKTRYDTSLGQLTKKFLKLLSDATDGVVNLNTACTLLSVPKRRLYDITNVLEGAGLVQKTSRNNIQWMGRMSSAISTVVKYDLEKEIDILEAKENKLDELIYHMKAEINALKEFEGKYHYVTDDDLKSIEDFSMKTVVGVKLAPAGQLIESSENKIVLTSKTTEIEAVLLSEDSSFTNILHPRAEFKENTFKVQICNNHLIGVVKEEADILYELPLGLEGESSYSRLCSEAAFSDGFLSGSSYSRLTSGTLWSEGDMVIKNAFITDEDDIAPMGKNFLLQTEDQDLEDLPFESFEQHFDNYSFSLDDGEGLADLFDCQFSGP